MKFLLAAVNAKYIHSNPAIYSLRAFAGKKLQPYIDLAEYTINQSMSDILADIYGRKPDVIGFSCYIWNWDIVRELLRELPKLLPDTDIWLGGPEVSYDAAEILRQFPYLTGIMVGEGEATFRELMERYLEKEQKLRFKDIPGLCLPEKASGESAPFYTRARELTDLNALPFLYENLEAFADRIIYYESSRGCPFRCSYCLSSIDKTVRFRDMGVIKKELQFFLDHQVKQVKFVDRTFNCNHSHALEIWRYIQEHDNDVTNFHFEISADILQEEEIALLNGFRPGLAQLEIGVQSVNPKTLEAVQRVTELNRLEQSVAAIRGGNNVHLHLDLIAGLPYEDYESFRNSFNRVYAMRPHQLQLGFLKVLKGSAMQEKAEEYGICYMDKPPYEVLYTRWLSYEDILRLKQVEEIVDLYYNSNQFTHTLPFLEQAFDSPFAMYERLAQFYAQHGFFVRNPARVSRYDILLAFAAACDEKYIDRYRELLTYDIYLRENMKSRPGFAAERTEDVKETVRKFYRREEEERVYLPAYAGCDHKQLSRMTHLESFCFPVWDEESMAESRNLTGRIEEELPCAYVLFDYSDAARSPLTREAGTCVIRSIT